MGVIVDGEDAGRMAGEDDEGGAGGIVGVKGEGIEGDGVTWIQHVRMEHVGGAC